MAHSLALQARTTIPLLPKPIPVTLESPFGNGQSESLPDDIVPDQTWPGMYRIRLPDGGLTDLINLTRAKDAIRQMEDQKLVAESL